MIDIRPTPLASQKIRAAVFDEEWLRITNGQKTNLPKSASHLTALKWFFWGCQKSELYLYFYKISSVLRGGAFSPPMIFPSENSNFDDVEECLGLADTNRTKIDTKINPASFIFLLTLWYIYKQWLIRFIENFLQLRISTLESALNVLL